MIALLIASALAGLLSAPHCAVMCGPIGAFTSQLSEHGLLRYQIGRTLGYSSAGALTAWFGQPIIAFLWQSNYAMALSWAMAIILLYAAFRSWPRSKTKPTSNDLISLHKSSKTKTPWVARFLSYFPKQPLYLGIGSVLIPCGALWGGLVIAASSGTPWQGGIAMSVFSLTSGTGLLASGVLAKLLQGSPIKKRILSVLFVLGALMLVFRPLMMAPKSTPAGDDKAQSNMPANCPLHSGSL